MPKQEEKELFTVVVHETQFTVSARRVHQLLQPHYSYDVWIEEAIRHSLLEEGVDYWQRQRLHDAPRQLSHSIVFSLYAIKKLCVSLYQPTKKEEKAAKDLFNHISTLQERLVPVCMDYLGSYLVYHLRWKPVDGQRLYNLKSVLKSLKDIGTDEAALRQEFPQHFTSYKGTNYVSYELVQQLHMERWAHLNKDFIKRKQPFEAVVV